MQINFEEIFNAVPSWTSVAEREELASLAGEVKPGGSIVEVGALYGGVTIILGKANPQAEITVVDNFSWSPIEERPASKEELLRNVITFGVKNVTVKVGDSRVIGKKWKEPIDLLWIDGGHSYEFVRADLESFGVHAQVIACHDWDNEFWPDIRQAVEDFFKNHPEWKVDHNTEMVVVLRKE